MPKFLEDKLKREARAKGFTGKKADKYVYGAMNNMGAMRGNKTTAKGHAMERKHKQHVPGGSMHDVIEHASEGTQIIDPSGVQSYCINEHLGQKQETNLEPDARGHHADEATKFGS